MEDTNTERTVRVVVPPVLTSDGAGVALKRSIGSRALDDLDPFLLLDHFGSSEPDDFIAGFPLHPHAGIETVTYMIKGEVTHRDSTGREGTIHSGDLQWMTAGRGIMHEEMPHNNPADPGLDGFQLWVNLPAKDKHCPPRYQDVSSGKLPTVVSAEGKVQIKVIAGEYNGIQGPITQVVAQPTFFDLTIQPGGEFTFSIPEITVPYAVGCYLFQGEALFGPKESPKGVDKEAMIVFSNKGDLIRVQVPSHVEMAARVLLLGGKVIGESIVRYGPFVTNTEEEVQEILGLIHSGQFPPK